MKVKHYLNLLRQSIQAISEHSIEFFKIRISALVSLLPVKSENIRQAETDKRSLCILLSTNRRMAPLEIQRNISTIFCLCISFGNIFLLCGCFGKCSSLSWHSFSVCALQRFVCDTLYRFSRKSKFCYLFILSISDVENM